jgi:hypothetical protein
VCAVAVDNDGCCLRLPLLCVVASNAQCYFGAIHPPSSAVERGFRVIAATSRSSESDKPPPISCSSIVRPFASLSLFYSLPLPSSVCHFSITAIQLARQCRHHRHQSFDIEFGANFSRLTHSLPLALSLSRCSAFGYSSSCRSLLLTSSALDTHRLTSSNHT